MAHHDRWRLFFGSVIALFLELVVIRWISTEVRVFAYFKNLALIAAFLGLGIGFATSERFRSLWGTAVGLILLTFGLATPFVHADEQLFRRMTALLSFKDFFLWGEQKSIDVNWANVAVGLALLLVLFALLVFLFVPIGRSLGRLMSGRGNRIALYSINIAGSIAGVWLFSLAAWASTPPEYWLVATALMLAAYALPDRRQAAAFVGVAVLAFGCIRLVAADAATSVQGPKGALGVSIPEADRRYWSPYQKLLLKEYRMGVQGVDDEIRFRVISVNDTFYQFIFNLSSEYIHAHPGIFQVSDEEIPYDFYNIPYRFRPDARRILIVGSGAGNDTAAAVRNTPAHVDAVEIDPVIYQLGRTLHPERPYSDPRVTATVDDARAFLKRSRDQYDMIVFGLLDSHTLASNYSNVSLDNYVYTVESFRDAAAHLAPDGVIVMSVAFTSWIGGRIAEGLRSVFGTEPLVFNCVNPFYRGTNGLVIVVGRPGVVSRALQGDRRLAEYVARKRLTLTPAPPTTDDWPFFWLPRKRIPTLHWLVITALAVISVAGTRLVVGRTQRPEPLFFFLGAAFLLMEVHLISKLMLLFGSTWVVNLFVITGVLLMALAANAFAARFAPRNLLPYFALLLASLLAVYALPLESMLGLGWLARGMVAALVSTSPLFFAGVIFAVEITRCDDLSHALGSNLLGAILGGLAETAAFLTGIRALTLLALALYMLAFLFYRRGRPLPGSAVA